MLLINLSYFALGLGLSIISNLLGVGGGIIIIPFLQNAWDHLALPVLIFTSLSVICLNSFLNIMFLKKKSTTRFYLFSPSLWEHL
jgi:uncharacterized membrane protein YfcA